MTDAATAIPSRIGRGRPGLVALIQEARDRQRRRRRLFTIIAVLAICCWFGFRLLNTSPTAGTQPMAACAAGDCRPSVPATIRLPNPCRLLTDSDIARAFGARVAYRTAHPEYHGCAWSGLPFPNQFGQQALTLDVAQVTRAQFEKAYSSWIVPGPTIDSRERERSMRVRGVGRAAFAENNGYDLEVWYEGTVLYITSTLVASPLVTEKKLAMAAIARLAEARDKARST